MHYHYFTLEQRGSIEAVIRNRLAEPGMQAALARLHTPEYGVCQACGADIPFIRLVADPLARGCRDCEPKL